MSDAVTPALTPEEWKYVTLAGSPDGVYGVELMVFPDGSINVERARDALYKGREKHAAAALCLYRRSFGFTREDVDAALRGAVGVGMNHDERCISTDGCTCNTAADRLEALAARIAALLPPED